MGGPKKLSQEEYDKFRSKMEEKYSYDKMSDEEKQRFDKDMDQVAVVEDKTDKTDTTDTTEDDQVEKGEFDDGHPQSHDDEDENVR